ncbi:MAG: hypothetical protein H7287_02535 [Thermoleophilia bacterium]|nr:hypothetical protein [Thermoleophilia bacterium]
MTTPAHITPDPATTRVNGRVDHRTQGFRNHAAWGLLGLAATASLWWAGTVPGAIGLFVVIGLAFVMWHFLGSRGAWMAVLLLGVIMSSLTGWQAITSARCPGAGDELVMSVTKPGVNCAQLRASAASMSVLFAFFALIAALTPRTVRKARAAAEVREDANGVAY